MLIDFMTTSLEMLGWVFLFPRSVTFCPEIFTYGCFGMGRFCRAIFLRLCERQKTGARQPRLSDIRYNSYGSYTMSEKKMSVRKAIIVSTIRPPGYQSYETSS